MPRLLPALAVCSLVLLGGCALMLHPTSSAAELSDRDAATVAETIVALVVDRIGAGEKVVLAAAVSTVGDDRLDRQIKKALEAHGYGPQANEAPAQPLHALSYLLTTYAGSYLLRVTIDGTDASTLLSRAAGGELVTNAPLTIQEAVR